MPEKRLTAAMVERISPPAKGQVEYWDKNMPGLRPQGVLQGPQGLGRADPAAWEAHPRHHRRVALDEPGKRP
jgi:hypothetical protein